MYSAPSLRKRRKSDKGLNLVPILDVVFILIFFLLSSSQLIRLFEIGSNLPIFREETSPPTEEEIREFKFLIELNRMEIFDNRTGKSLSVFSLDDRLYTNLQNFFQAQSEMKISERAVMRVNKRVVYQKLVSVLDDIRKVGKVENRVFTKMVFEDT